MKITVETTVNADLDTVWDPWNSPEDIKRWNSAQDDWHTILDNFATYVEGQR